MVEITALFNTNGFDNELDKLNIEPKAIEEFTRTGFCSNSYDGIVEFKAMPRAINPDFLQIAIELGDIAETLIDWITICTAITKFIKKCHGYMTSLSIKKQNKTLLVNTKNDIVDEKELEKAIKKTLDSFENNVDY